MAVGERVGCGGAPSQNCGTGGAATRREWIQWEWPREQRAALSQYGRTDAAQRAVGKWPRGDARHGVSPVFVAFKGLTA